MKNSNKKVWKSRERYPQSFEYDQNNMNVQKNISLYFRSVWLYRTSNFAHLKDIASLLLHTIFHGVCIVVIVSVHLPCRYCFPCVFKAKSFYFSIQHVPYQPVCVCVCLYIFGLVYFFFWWFFNNVFPTQWFLATTHFQYIIHF